MWRRSHWFTQHFPSVFVFPLVCGRFYLCVNDIPLVVWSPVCVSYSVCPFVVVLWRFEQSLILICKCFVNVTKWLNVIVSDWHPVFSSFVIFILPMVLGHCFGSVCLCEFWLWFWEQLKPVFRYKGECHLNFLNFYLQSYILIYIMLFFVFTLAGNWHCNSSTFSFLVLNKKVTIMSFDVIWMYVVQSERTLRTLLCCRFSVIPGVFSRCWQHERQQWWLISGPIWSDLVSFGQIESAGNAALHCRLENEIWWIGFLFTSRIERLTLFTFSLLAWT